MSSPAADDFYSIIFKEICLCCFLNGNLHFCVHIKGKIGQISRIRVISRILTLCITCKVIMFIDKLDVQAFCESFLVF